MSKRFRLRQIHSGAISIVTEDEYALMQGKGWIGKKLVVEEITIDSEVKTAFKPPADLVKLVPKDQQPEPEAVKRGRGRPKKQNIDA